MSRQQPFDPDQPDEDEFDRMQELLNEHVSDFVEHHDLPLGVLSPMLLNLAVMTRMGDYVLTVGKPSGSGLKLDLDRMRRDLDDLVRQSKRSADDFVAHSKEELRKAMEADAEAEAEAERDDREAPRKP